MSIEAMTWALSADVGDATRKLVLIGYANHAHKGGRHSWASKDTIAEYANCSKRTVQRHVDALLEGGWLRRGDQAQVAHLRADRRPVVYDLAMTEAVRTEWAAERVDSLSPRRIDDDPARGDAAVSPRETGTGGQTVTPPTGHGVTDGVSQPCPPRGVTAVSTEPYLNQEPSPLPPASGGTAPATGCIKHPHEPGRNCRGCGTTNRQLAEQRRRDEDARRRQTEQEQLQAERERLAARRRPAEDVADLLADTRRTMATQKRRTA